MRNYKDDIYTIFTDILFQLSSEIEKPDTLQHDNEEYISAIKAKLENLQSFHPEYKKIFRTLSPLDVNDIKTCRRYIQNENTSSIDALKYLFTVCYFDSEDIEGYTKKYIEENIFSKTEENKFLKQKLQELEETILYLKKQLKEKETTVSRSNSEFTRDNITVESLKSANRIEIKNSEGYTNTYSSIQDLFNNEPINLEPTIKRGFNGLVDVLKAREKTLKKDAEFICFSLDGYRIDIYFKK